MRLAPIASILVACLALNAETIQGRVVRVVDGDVIMILDGSQDDGAIETIERIGITARCQHVENGIPKG